MEQGGVEAPRRKGVTASDACVLAACTRVPRIVWHPRVLLLVVVLWILLQLVATEPTEVADLVLVTPVQQVSLILVEVQLADHLLQQEVATAGLFLRQPVLLALPVPFGRVEGLEVEALQVEYEFGRGIELGDSHRHGFGHDV